MHYSLTEDEARFWDILLKVVAGIAALISAIWSVHQYIDAQREHQRAFENQIRAEKLQAQQPFLAKQLEVCLELTEAAARVATDDSNKKKADLQQFRMIATGPLRLISEAKISKAALDAYDCFKFSRCPAGPGGDSSPSYYARQVARACHDSTEKFWDVQLPSETNDYPLK